LLKTSVCLYAMPPHGSDAQGSYSEAPLIGALPKTPHVYLAAYGGGICAKHALAIGEALSRLLQGEPMNGELADFDPGRLLPKHER
jgi:hypothetical protein